MRTCRNGHQVSPYDDRGHYGCAHCIRESNREAVERYRRTTKGIVNTLQGYSRTVLQRGRVLEEENGG